MDETKILICEKWMFLYRAVSKARENLDFILSERRNRPASVRLSGIVLYSSISGT
ncbi:DDE-type integrase/transposase/recombinase [Ruegeria lacuscaerulensis]|uniref:DDE-type integrase/transposase/recombinase n=1 Tax=Ruegeria lacuscaerulensis TaxID=55218 RepID=UPI00147CFD2D